MTLANLTSLSGLSFPKLTSVECINWSSLPMLKQLIFTNKVNASKWVYISDTSLLSLDGIDPSVIEVFSISNNPLLKNVNVSATIVNSQLILSDNNPSLGVIFPNLVTALDITLINTALVSFPKLKAVYSKLQFSRGSMKSLLMPTLTQIQGNVQFTDNPLLVDLSMPWLSSIDGGFTIVNNSALMGMDFPALNCTGGILITGNFER
jgi:hypothetical protein